ncbi:uncharacterized protein VTP21DRAFT_11632 [Calcarisporiella thermophila]|uniref:uncharacterized protein n=1 Tax=Calcarisporiella thermophila TaxID=911321 RepID=UPI003742F2EB
MTPTAQALYSPAYSANQSPGVEIPISQSYFNPPSSPPSSSSSSFAFPHRISLLLSFKPLASATFLETSFLLSPPSSFSFLFASFPSDLETPILRRTPVNYSTPPNFPPAFI